MAYEFVARREKFSNAPAQLGVNYLEMLDQVASLAVELLRSPGAQLLGQPDGEDSAGRAKLRAMEVKEVVTRSFDIAQAVFDLAKERGNIINLPSQAEIENMAREHEDKN